MGRIAQTEVHDLAGDTSQFDERLTSDGFVAPDVEAGCALPDEDGEASGQLAVGDPIKVSLFNVKYSPNLGDGIIAECFEHALEEADERLNVRSIDLAGRTGFDPKNGSGRKRLIAVLEKLPRALRKIAVPLAVKLLVDLRISKRWQDAVAASDVVVFGGGNLFADRDQNFPIKLARAVDMCSARGLPIAVASVGVSSDWSAGGKSRLTNSLSRCRLISCTVRDELSKRNWSSFWNEDLPRADLFRTPELAIDPGILAAERYGVSDTHGASGRIGVCLTSPQVLRLHGQSGCDGYGGVWIVNFVRAIVAHGHAITLFTNGSPEDQQFLNQLQLRMPATDSIAYQDRFTRPEDLAHFIASLDAVIGHRLHACIVAHSYGLPTTGMVWDKKLDSFFQAIDRSRFLLDPDIQKPDEAAQIALESFASAPDPEALARLKYDCLDAIKKLARQVVKSGRVA